MWQQWSGRAAPERTLGLCRQQRRLQSQIGQQWQRKQPQLPKADRQSMMGRPWGVITCGSLSLHGCTG